MSKTLCRLIGACCALPALLALSSKAQDGKAPGAKGEHSAAKGINGNQADNPASESGAAFIFGYQ